MEKLTYEFVKQSFESEGYTLLSTEYVNARECLRYVCPNGSPGKTKWLQWHNGRRCPCDECRIYCKKPTIEFVKQSFESEGYTLLSTEYVNCKSYLEYICPNGHHGKIFWNNWQQGQRCPCHCNRMRITNEFAHQSFESEGYTLISTYVNSNNKSYLEYICPNGNHHKITWGAWQQGTRCPCDKCCKYNGSSTQERELQEFAKKIHTGIVLTNDRSMIQNPLTGEFLELDIYMPNIKKAIEYCAEHWHSDPGQKWRDQYKQKWCKDNGIVLLRIDHKTWIKNKNFNMIQEFINNI